jgi:hypothetical protein
VSIMRPLSGKELLFGCLWTAAAIVFTAVLLWSLLGCACTKTFPFNEAHAEELQIRNLDMSGGDSIIIQPLYIIKTEPKTRRHATDCNHCSYSGNGVIHNCTLMACPTATYRYNLYSIGTADGKILFTIEDKEKEIKGE